MKYIFRYSILVNFPHPDHKITEEQLSEALKSLKFQFNKYDLGFLEQLSVSCIQKILTKPQQKVLSIIEQIFSSHKDQVPQFNAKQLEGIWQQEKVNVYKVLIHENSSSSLSLNDVKWSVRNTIMRRNQSLGLNKDSNIVTRIDFNCLQKLNKSKQIDGSGVEKREMSLILNKKGVQRMYNSLVDCQNAINQILMSQ